MRGKNSRKTRLRNDNKRRNVDDDVGVGFQVRLKETSFFLVLHNISKSIKVAALTDAAEWVGEELEVLEEEGGGGGTRERGGCNKVYFENFIRGGLYLRLLIFSADSKNRSNGGNRAVQLLIKMIF